MTTIELNDGTSVPWIAFGTGTALYGKDAAGTVKQAIDGGFTHLDGAQIYKNEESLGQGIKDSGKPREELFVTTKLGMLKDGESVKQSLKDSLKKLGLDYVDLFLVHSPVPHTGEGRLQEVWKEVVGVKNDGLAKSIGVSNFKVKHLKDILSTHTIKPSVNQIEFHPYVWKASQGLYELSEQENIKLASYAGLSPLIRAQNGPLKGIVPGIRERLEKNYGKPVTEGQVLLKWLNQKGIIIVTTTSSKERIQEYLDTAKVPDLTAEEISAIDENGEHQRFFVSVLHFRRIV
ncbi:Aldo/keto reductase [Athelia psychrophila]|uniref:Aldo/keto reductase n=1 Tax=Athelia psychrophila TaxID=1759441 RepID=A0A166I8E4_9AGAM|nr:Aldo/keto reductase [Fibularhizoctonia sp. CBS 109695]